MSMEEKKRWFVSTRLNAAHSKPVVGSRLGAESQPRALLLRHTPAKQKTKELGDFVNLRVLVLGKPAYLKSFCQPSPPFPLRGPSAGTFAKHTRRVPPYATRDFCMHTISYVAFGAKRAGAGACNSYSDYGGYFTVDLSQ